MSWILLVLIAIIASSFNFFLDNYTSDFYFKGKDANGQKMFYGPIFLVLGVIFLFAGGLDFVSADPKTLILFFVSGLLVSLSTVAYFKALEIDNSTNVSIFVQLKPVLYLILGWAFLGDSLSMQQLLAFLLILSVPFLIILTTKKRSRDTQIKAVFYVVIYVIIRVSSDLIFVKENVPELNFITEMAFVFLGKGVCDLLIMYTHPKWRKRFNYVLKRSNKKVLCPLFSSATIGVVKTFAYQLALLAAPTVAIASATTDSITPIMVFFLGIVFTIIWPKFGREKLNRKVILVHLVATILVALGIVLIQI